ncbi:MAG TPA: hypothetical protein VFL78_00580 [Rhodanobacteraceae bacterium]|nr:hypothetical protein [Rhodanobacteraceae bacterium]
MHSRLALAIVAGLLLAACGSSDQTPADQAASASSSQTRPAPAATNSSAATPPAGKERFNSVRLGFRIDYPASMASQLRFDSKYLANDSWKTYAKPDSTGTPVLMLTLPGSNDVTAGELRIGISSDKKEIARCDTPPGNADKGSIGKTTINGTTFASFHAADAGMSHYLKVHSYRVVHGHYCYAIDLLVTGTNPKVYDPPRKPPFSNEEAFKQLHEALQGFRFTR